MTPKQEATLRLVLKGLERSESALHKARAAINEALAEQPAQQERVMWGVDWGRAGDQPCVSIIQRLPNGGIEVLATEYGPPASKPWVGLEESEWREIDDRHDWTTTQGRIDAAEEIEAKLREKNNG